MSLLRFWRVPFAAVVHSFASLGLFSNKISLLTMAKSRVTRGKYHAVVKGQHALDPYLDCPKHRSLPIHLIRTHRTSQWTNISEIYRATDCIHSLPSVQNSKTISCEGFSQDTRHGAQLKASISHSMMSLFLTPPVKVTNGRALCQNWSSLRAALPKTAAWDEDDSQYRQSDPRNLFMTNVDLWPQRPF